MTHMELARELAVLEGAEVNFDFTVRAMIDTKRKEIMQGILASGGRSPSQAVADAKILEGALEKIDCNLRSQYEEFLSALAQARASTFTTTQIQGFIVTLRQPAVRDYLLSTIRFSRELNEPVNRFLTQMMRRAITGAPQVSETPSSS